MSKLSKEMTGMGECIGRGSDRVAYLYRDKVYKIPVNSSSVFDTQADLERQAWERMPEKLKSFFPNPVFYGRVVEMDRVYVAEQDEEFDTGFYGIETDFEDEDFQHDVMYSSQMSGFLELKGVEVDWDAFFELLSFFNVWGISVLDICDTTGDFGLEENGEFKIVDWGFSS